MRRRSPLLAINIQGDHLTAVLAAVGSGRAVVRGWVTARRPDSVAMEDAAAVGAWVGARLKEAGLMGVAGRRSAVFAAPRGEVVLKRLSIPSGATEDELPDIVALQLGRQLTVAPDQMAIDFVPLSDSDGSGGWQVLAGALPADRLEWRRTIAKSAGLDLAGVGLKSSGAAELVSHAHTSGGGEGVVLAVTLGLGSTEFVIVDGGQVVFARSVELARGAADGDPVFAERVAVEAKRTWMSYRVAPESADVHRVAVLGQDEVSRQVAQSCGDALEIEADTIGFPQSVRVPPDMPPGDRSACAPLIGLLLAAAADRPLLNFADPRRTPDAGAPRRQLVLAGVLGLVLLIGGSWTAARLSIQSLEGRLEDAKSRREEAYEQYKDLQRTVARLNHVRLWREARFDWSSHLSNLVEMLPDPRVALLDQLAVSSDAAVVFTLPKGSKKYHAAGTWSNPARATISIDGRMKDRAAIESLRSQFVADNRYRVSILGSDVADRFDWKLTTGRLSLDEPVASDPEAPPPGAGAAAERTPGAAERSGGGA